MFSKTLHDTAFSTFDCFLLVFVTFVSFYTRFWRMGLPNEIIFDEVYFGNFTNSYIKNEFYDDIHPPLGKMIMALIAYMTGYPGNIEWGDSKHDYNISEINYVSLRLTMNVFSSLCTPLIYGAACCLGFSYLGKLSVSSLVCFDFTIITEGRFILSDGILHFFTALHIFAFCFHCRKPTRYRSFFAGLTMGAALSCKYTALGLLALDGLIQIYWIFSAWPSNKAIFTRAFDLLFPCFSVFYISWVVHFIIMSYHSSSSYHATNSIYETLINKEQIETEYWGKRVSGKWLPIIIYQYNIKTHKANMRITSPHPWSSMPKNWPFLMDKPVLFYQHENSTVKCLGSPMTYWSSSLSLIITFIIFIFKSFAIIFNKFLKMYYKSNINQYKWPHKDDEILEEKKIVRFSKKLLLLFGNKLNWTNLVPVVGWIVSYFPFLLVPRAMYMYHYIVPMMFASLSEVALIENLFKTKLKVLAIINTLIICLSIICFWFFYPWIMGVEWPDSNSTRKWLNRWEFGPPIPVNTEGLKAFNTTLKRAPIPL